MSENKGVQTEEVTLTRVLAPAGERTIVAKVVPFDRRNEKHTDFVFSFMDMMGRCPSEFNNMSDAAKGYVDLFMVHREDDKNDPNSDFACVRSDTRACRTLFNQPDTQKAIADFFVNA